MTKVLEAQFVVAFSTETVNIKELIYSGIPDLSKVSFLYEKGMKRKAADVVLFFPKKGVFDGVAFRTALLNESVELIYKLGAAFSGNKKGEIVIKNEISSLLTHKDSNLK
jgi:hypothetical protein